ncbi:MAG: LytTR family DNA-binding domain-containing protein [Bacteroidota bacterium]
MVKILIVDDEVAAGSILKILIEKHIATATEIRFCDNPKDALELLKVFNPTLVMLDIEMPNLSGFDFLNMASENHFDVIFTTAYDQYAIKAIRFSALDYLLKPIDVLDLQNAVNRHIIKKQNQNPQLLVSNLLTNLQQKDPKDFKLALSTSEGVFFYEPLEILYCEGENNYTRFVFAKHKPMLVSKTLGDYEDLLADHGFLRIHKSYLVNAKYVTRVDREGMVQMSDGKQLSISKRRKELIMNTLRQH